MAPERGQAECPHCHRRFDTVTAVVCHLNHPYLSCANWFLPLDPQRNSTSSPVRDSPEPPPHITFPLSGHVFDQDQGFIDKFHTDRFAEHRAENLYFPFASKDEWELAAFLTQSNLSMKVIDAFLSLVLVSCR
jgi:hypothetical protein